MFYCLAMHALLYVHAVLWVDILQNHVMGWCDMSLVLFIIVTGCGIVMYCKKKSDWLKVRLWRFLSCSFVTTCRDWISELFPLVKNWKFRYSYFIFRRWLYKCNYLFFKEIHVHLFVNHRNSILPLFYHGLVIMLHCFTRSDSEGLNRDVNGQPVVKQC